MRASRFVVPALAGPLLLIAIVSCKSDGRTLRPALPSQVGSVFTPTTSTTIVVEVALPQPSGGLPDFGEGGDDGSVATAAFTLQMPWADGGVIAPRYTCSGENQSPGFTWAGTPPGTVEMALVVTDTDAGGFVHWVIAGLDPATPVVYEGAVPVAAIEGSNDFTAIDLPTIGWAGPCPPAGSKHHYRFTLYALDQQIELPTGSPAADLIAVIEAASVQAAQVTGTYSSP